MTQQQPHLPYLNIEIYREAILTHCSEVLSRETINIVANMLAMTEALKLQNYHDGTLKLRPEEHTVLAQTYAQNMAMYLAESADDLPSSNENNVEWLTIFTAAIAGSQGKQHKVQANKSELQAETLSIQYVHGDEELHLEMSVEPVEGRHVTVHKNIVLSKQRAIHHEFSELDLDFLNGVTKTLAKCIVHDPGDGGQASSVVSVMTRPGARKFGRG